MSFASYTVSVSISSFPSSFLSLTKHLPNILFASCDSVGLMRIQSHRSRARENRVLLVSLEGSRLLTITE